MKKELKLGEVGEINGVLVKCIPVEGPWARCHNCEFLSTRYEMDSCFDIKCEAIERKDNRNVNFTTALTAEEVKNYLDSKPAEEVDTTKSTWTIESWINPAESVTLSPVEQEELRELVNKHYVRKPRR